MLNRQHKLPASKRLCSHTPRKFTPGSSLIAFPHNHCSKVGSPLYMEYLHTCRVKSPSHFVCVSKAGAGPSTRQNTDRLAIGCLFRLLPHMILKCFYLLEKLSAILLTNHLTWPSSVFPFILVAHSFFFSNVKSTKHFLLVENIILDVLL